MTGSGRGGEIFDGTHRPFIDYIDRTREHYLAAGFDNPYRWAQHADVPFVRPAKPMAECRVGLITTAAEFAPEKGDQGPHALYNPEAKFHEVYSRPVEPPPDLRISHLTYDRRHTVPADIDAYFPLRALTALAAEGAIGEVAPRFHAVPTTRSQRQTVQEDAPEILRRCREDGIDAAVLVAI